MDEVVTVPLATIRLDYGLDADGEPVYDMNIEGDIPYLVALGMIQSAILDIPDVFDELS